MSKVSLAVKMRIQTLREQRLGAKAIMAAYPDKGWALSTVKICQRVIVGQNLRALKQTPLLSFLMLKNR